MMGGGGAGGLQSNVCKSVVLNIGSMAAHQRIMQIFVKPTIQHRTILALTQPVFKINAEGGTLLYDRLGLD
jgi:hypothetical protein